MSNHWAAVVARDLGDASAPTGQNMCGPQAQFLRNPTRNRFQLLRLIDRVRRDECGSILIQATLIIVVIFGMLGLALDGGRLFMVNNDLHDLADAAALAGAAKLDGTVGARQRADSAARTLNNNVRWWNVAGSKILPGIRGVEFYETLSDLDANKPAENDKTANYIKVSTGSWQVAPTFLVGVGTASSNSTRATAEAESHTAMCVPASMMLCNPNEPLRDSTGDTSNFNPTPGTMFIFSTTEHIGDLRPGVFTLLQDARQDNSDPAIENLLAQQTANFCSMAGTSPAHGQKTRATQIGINVRFDQQPNGTLEGLDQTPAPIKIGGWVPRKGANFCSSDLVSDTPTPYSRCANDHTISCALPRDRSLISIGDSQIGACPPCGSEPEDLQAYWSNHHPGTLPAGVSTRYQVYQLEVAETGNAGTWLTDATEPHGPLCTPASAQLSPEFAAARRVVPVAVVDCLYWGVRRNSVNNIRINSYADFFLTEPAPIAGITRGNIYTEFVTMHRFDDGGSGLHSIVRLVR
jgi:hypothetical protein